MPRTVPVNETANFRFQSKVCKVDDRLGLVLGWGIICKSDGSEYFDLQADSVTEEGMLEAGLDFMRVSRKAKEMHRGGTRGEIVFAFPMTAEIAKAFGIETKTHGLMIGLLPDQDMLAKFKSGELTGFSLGGKCLEADLL